MSHVAQIKAEFRDLEAIKAAASRLGLPWKESQKTYRWWGHSVGDYPLPEGMTDADLGTCDHAFGPVPGSVVNANRGENGYTHNSGAYEVGVKRLADGRYAILWDFIDGTLRTAMGGNEAHKFTQAYAVEKARIEARRKGLRVTEQTAADGTIRLTCTPMGATVAR